MKLHELKPAVGARKPRKRVGRGPGSGTGKTSGRGHNGQKSRSGYSARHGFEGGQMPLVRRLPKRGFVNIFRKVFRVVNIDKLNALEAGTVVSPEMLQELGVLRKGRHDVKVLGNGELNVKLTVQAHKFTKSAVEKIESAGGTVEQIVVVSAKAPGKLSAKSSGRGSDKNS